MLRAQLGFLLALCIGASACGASSPPAGPAADSPDPGATSAAVTGKRPLRVTLFPYIPADLEGKAGLARLRDMLESKFEEQNPRIDLQLAEMDPAAGEFYDKAKFAAWLRDAVYDVAEMDTLMLGEMVGELAEWEPRQLADFHPAAREAVKLHGRSYGVPHYMCGHFVYSRDPNVVRADDVQSLVKRLEAMPRPAAKLGAPIRGSFNLPSLFLDAYVDSHPRASLDGVITQPDFPDRRLLRGLGSLVRTCAVGERNPCLDDTYPDANPAIDDFAAEKTGAYIGYSESLHRILVRRKDAAPILVTSAPLGAGSSPLLFTDALVRRKGCKDACARDAQTFAEFLTSPATMELVLMGDDLDSGVARYLLPATKSAFAVRRIANDATYRVLERAIQWGRPFPNHDLFDVMADGQKSEQLLGLLKKAAE